MKNKEWIEKSYENDCYVDSESLKIKNELSRHANIAHMGQIVVSSKDKSIIGTTALDTCYGIVFYDRNNKFGMVGHAAPSTKIDTLRDMIKMLGDMPRTIEYSIVSGFRNHERKYHTGINELLEYLYNNCPSNINLVPLKSDLDVQECSNVLAYEFAFEVNTALPVGKHLFYCGENLNNRKYKL